MIVCCSMNFWAAWVREAGDDEAILGISDIWAWVSGVVVKRGCLGESLVWRMDLVYTVKCRNIQNSIEGSTSCDRILWDFELRLDQVPEPQIAAKEV